MPSSTAPPRPLPSPRSALVRGGGRHADAVTLDREIVSFFVEAAGLLGIPKSLAAIYGICFASPDPLSFSDIQERLDISAGSISQGIRVLREVGALKVAPPVSDGTNGQRRGDRFEPALGLRELAVHLIDEKLRPQLNSGRARLQAISEAIPPSRHASSKVLRERIDALQTWHHKARTVLPLVKAFLRVT